MKNLNNLIDNLHHDGYIIVKSAINSSQVDNVLSDIAKIFQQDNFEPYSLTELIIKEFRENNQLYKAKLRCIRSLISMLKLSDYCLKFFYETNKGVVPQFAAWPNLHLQHPEIIFKSGYDRLPPHQEYHYTRGSLDSLVAWSPLFASSSEHFPLEVIKGSHKNGLLPHKLVGNNKALETLNPNDYSDSEFTRLEVNVGDIVLFSSFLIHRTGNNLKNNVDLPIRIAVNYQFNNLLENSIINRSYQLFN